MTARVTEPDEALVRVCDLAGRPRGTGFLADADGTMITSHEAVDGLARLVLHAPGDQVCLVEAAAITALPEAGLALVATEGLSLPPLPIAPGGPADPGGRVRMRLPQPATGVVLGTAAVTYTATDRFHLLDEVYELALDAADMTPVTPQASGAPVIDAATGAVLAVVATALQGGHRAGGFAVPLRAAGAARPLAELLARNAATVPGYGAHLNLAGALRLTAASVGTVAGPGEWREPVGRAEVARATADFLALRGDAAPLVLGLVGEPGTGRSTELAALAARRARGPLPQPTVWLRGAELRPGDGGIKDAVERALRNAAGVAGAAGPPHGAGPAAGPLDPTDAVAALAREAGRPLLVLLDGPEEMPPVLAHALADWTAGTLRWLRSAGVRLVVGCRPEHWEQAGALLPPGSAYGWHTAGASVRALPPCVRLGDLDEEQAAAARARYGLAPAALAPADAAHPLTMRLLSEVRAALPEGGAAHGGGPPSREEVFGAHLDLVCLRVAVRLAAGAAAPVRGAEVRRLAARVAGQVHEAARRCLGPGQGELDREAFEELFPWRTGWASAVLTEGLLVPAGAAYRFAHEEAADWLQGLHLDLDQALHALVHRWFAGPADPADPGEAPVRLPSRSAATRAGQPPPVPPAPSIAPPSSPRSLPVPRHRAGPVVQSLLLAARNPAVLTRHLTALIHALDQQSPPLTRCAPAPVPRSAPVAAPVPRPSADLEADTIPNPRARRAARPELAPVLAPLAAGPGEPDVRNRWSGSGAARGPVPASSSEGSGADEQRPEGRQSVPEAGARQLDAQWWAAHLLREVLLRVGDGDAYRGVLRELAGRVAVRSVERGGFSPEGLGGLGEFGPWFWRSLPLATARRLELLRLLLPADPPPADRRLADDPAETPSGRPPAAGPAADGPPAGVGVAGASGAAAAAGAPGRSRPVAGSPVDGLPGGAGPDRISAERPAERPGGPESAGPEPDGLRPAAGPSAEVPLAGADAPACAAEPPRPEGRFLTAVADVMRDAPGEALAVVCGWFDDDRPLRTAPRAGGGGAPRLTVASAAQALLYAHRSFAVDDLIEALLTAAHPAADEVLAALAEDEPSAMCRAVDRWAHDPRADRHAAAASYGLLTAPFARSEADRELLRYAALAVLARPQDGALHGAALGLLVRDPVTRARHLPAAVARFATGDPLLPVAALAAALDSDPEPVLAAFRGRLRGAAGAACEVLPELAAVTEPGPARRAAALVHDHLLHRPDSASDAARFLDLRLEQGPGVRGVLLPFAAALLHDHPAPVRRALAPVLADPGSHLSRPLRQELLEIALATERDPDVLDALLTAAADGCRRRAPVLTADLVHRLGLLLGRTAEGAARFDGRLVALAAQSPDFARLVRGWIGPDGNPVWDAVIGPSARRSLDAGSPNAGSTARLAPSVRLESA